MSLLNNMLNDLEKRQTTTGTGQSLSESAYLSSPVRKTGSGPIFLVGIVIVAAAGFLWLNQHDARLPVMQAADANKLPKVSTASAAVTPSLPRTAPASASMVTPALPQQAIRPEDHAGNQVTVSGVGETHSEVTTEKPAAEPVLVLNGHGKRSAPGSVAETSFKVIRPQQRSDNFYRKAVSLMQQSRLMEAQQALRAAIRTNAANHSARLLLAELLVDAGSNTEAAALLRAGLDLSPGHSDFSMALARVQMANGARDDAISTLEQGLSAAGDDAEYHALLAALLQKQGRHADAIQHYITALRSNPAMPGWLIGVGISLKAEGRMNEADEAFQRAIDTGALSPEVAQYAEGQLKLIRQPH